MPEGNVYLKFGMPLNEVAATLGYDESTIRKIGKDLFPNVFQNGIKTYLTEYQVTAIKMHLGKNSELPKTNLEKKLLVQQAMIILNEEIDELKNINNQLTNRIGLLTHNPKTYTITELAKELNLKSGIELNRMLEEKGIQYKVNKTWVLTAKYSDRGYESIKSEELDNGQVVYNRHWTGAGREFILNLFSGR